MQGNRNTSTQNYNETDTDLLSHDNWYWLLSACFLSFTEYQQIYDKILIEVKERVKMELTAHITQVLHEQVKFKWTGALTTDHLFYL